MKNKSMTTYKNNSKVSTIILVIVFLVGLSVLCYPSISNYVNERTMSKAVVNYDETVSSLSEVDYTELLAQAEEYNEAVREAGLLSSIIQSDQFSDYNDILDVNGSGMIGYITIEKINVELPIYHGTSSKVLSSGAGHLEGTSLPIGGESTHAVISAHRGLPSSKLFTDLDELEIGDTFTITVLDEVLTYEVDQISIILPSEVDNLYIEDGEDYVTLMTCTPYGINSHRLLVRGKRIETTVKTTRVDAMAYKVDPVLVAVFIAVPMLIVLLIWLLVKTRKKDVENN